jgi:hypothetical protein
MTTGCGALERAHFGHINVRGTFGFDIETVTSTGDVARLKFVKAAQGPGFSLGEVMQLLALDDGTRCTGRASWPTRIWSK